MGFIKYAFQRLRAMNKRAMLDKIDEIHQKTGKNRAFIFFDMVGCGFLHGAGYMDYWLFEMYSMNRSQRKTVLTRGRNDRIVKKYNDKAYNKYFINKANFNKTFSKYLGRDWLLACADNKADIMAFFSRHDEFMAKPYAGQCGRGIEKITVSEWPDREKLYDYIMESGKTVLEQVIKQHKDVAAIYPTAINTVRVVTVLDHDKVAIPFVYFRIGAGGRIVDNFNSQGMVAPVDEKTGVVRDKAIDKKKNLYECHPDTGTPIKGFKFPYWDEIQSMCREAAHIVPQIGYVGWDVAITPNGPVFVEANEFPGHDIYQLPEHTPDRIGAYPQYLNAEFK